MDTCGALADVLPDRLDGADRRAAEPTSELTAAWGDPPIVLRCGVGRPDEYEPTSVVGTFDGVDWLPLEQEDGYVFYATGRVVWVEVAVPDEYAPEVNPLIDLAAAITTAVPLQER